MSKEQIELHAAELELKRLKLEVNELEKPFYLKYQFLSIFTPVLIALIPFLTVGVQAYFDSTKRKLEQTKQSLTNETQALIKQNTQLQANIEKLSKTSIEYLNQLESQHQEYSQKMSSITDTLNAEITKDKKQHLDAKEKALIALDEKVSGSITASSQQHLEQLDSLNKSFESQLADIKKELNYDASVSKINARTDSIAKLN